MTHLDHIIDVDDLEREIAAGYITRRFHPEFPSLAIVNYSDRCQFDRHWTATTTTARGIIYDTDTLEVIARPIPKLFNYGDPLAPQLDPDAPIVGAYDKVDGSLGIQYRLPDGRQAIATRGSFVSEQAIHATEWLRANGWDVAGPLYTWLWEIVYPENRIVLDYGDRDELVHLGAVNVERGAFHPATPPGLPPLYAVAERFPARTMREVLAYAPRTNAEGFVVWLDANRAVKIKQDDYLALHRIVSHLTVKEVWRQLRAGTYEAFAAALPDEFHDWARDTATDLELAHSRTTYAAARQLIRVEDKRLPDRKAQALWINEHVPVEHRGLVFRLLDGKSIVDAVWRMVEPAGSTPMRAAASAE